MPEDYGVGSDVLTAEVDAPESSYGSGSSVVTGEVSADLLSYGSGSVVRTALSTSPSPDPETYGLGSSVVTREAGLPTQTFTVWADGARRPAWIRGVQAGGAVRPVTGTTPPPPPPPPPDATFGTGSRVVARQLDDSLPTDPTVPPGFERSWMMKFDSPNWTLENAAGTVTNTNARALWNNPHASYQNNTRSRSITGNVISDSESGNLLMRVDDVTTSDQPYSSSYISTRSTFFQPLEGRYEALLKFPMAHSVWPCFWMDAGGSADRFEIDAAEMFTAAAPGRCSIVLHSRWYGGSNLDVKPNISSGFDWKIPATSRPYVGPLGATRWGRAVDWHPPQDWQNSPWVKVSVDISKIWNLERTRYTIRIEIRFNDKLILTYTDPFNPNTGLGPSTGGSSSTTFGSGDAVANVWSGNCPVWVQNWLNNPANSEDRFWDMRLDTWVGGLSIGRSWVETAGPRVYTYDGFLQNGTAGAPTSTNEVPSALADRWPYDTEVAWIQALLPA